MRHAVVGSTIAALVAADALASEGREVDFFTSPRAGGGFMPFRNGDRLLDLGARLIELSYDSAPPPAPSLETYRPGPHGHRPFIGLVDSLVRSLAGDDLAEVDAPLFHRAGVTARDFVMTGDLSELGRLLSPAEQAAVAKESAQCAASEGPAGAFAEARRGELWQTTLAEMMRRHCGEAFPRALIDPIAERIISGGTERVIAALHRKIWLPLFHPQTLARAVSGQLDYYPERPMYTLPGGGMSAVVTRLAARVAASPRVTIVHVGKLMHVARTCSATSLRFECGTTVESIRPIIAADPAEMLAAAGIGVSLARVSLKLLWVDVAESKVDSELSSLLWIGDRDSPVFRVSPSLAQRRPGVQTFTCELAHDVVLSDVHAAAAEWLCRSGIATDVEAVSPVATLSAPALIEPSAANRALFDGAVAALGDCAFDAEFAGSICGFAVDSFNEQVVQGLRAARALG